MTDDTIKIVVAGLPKSGKSTFINSLLGREILPTPAKSSTVINQIVYSEKPKAVVHFKHPKPPILARALPISVFGHMKKYGDEEIPPLEIPVSRINDFIAKPFDKETKAGQEINPYKNLVLSWPSALLKKNIELIELPYFKNALSLPVTPVNLLGGILGGANFINTLKLSNFLNSPMALYIKSVKMILFMVSADEPQYETVVEYLEFIKILNPSCDILFLVNRFDVIFKLAKSTLNEFTRSGSDGIFFASAFDALYGKTNNDGPKYRQSGMPEFENALNDLLKSTTNQ